jgi:hypothetical protein
MVVAVSGYEQRSPYLSQRIQLGGETKIALAFHERKHELNRPRNDEVFGGLGFEFIHASGEACIDLEELLAYLPSTRQTTLTLLVDYSCMTKPWYASFINYFSQHNPGYQKVRILFAYTLSGYVEPKKPKPLKEVEQVGCSPHSITPGKPMALVMGLGYEKDRAEFLRKSVDPETTYCFYADPAGDERFVERVYINNFKLIDSLHRRNVFSFPLGDMYKTDRLLTSLCLELRLKYRVILAPLGPKPFALLCMLVAARYPDIEVWRVSAGQLESIYDRKPLGEPLVYCVEFGCEDTVD